MVPVGSVCVSICGQGLGFHRLVMVAVGFAGDRLAPGLSLSPPLPHSHIQQASALYRPTKASAGCIQEGHGQV